MTWTTHDESARREGTAIEAVRRPLRRRRKQGPGVPQREKQRRTLRRVRKVELPLTRAERRDVDAFLELVGGE